VVSATHLRVLVTTCMAPVTAERNGNKVKITPNIEDPDAEFHEHEDEIIPFDELDQTVRFYLNKYRRPVADGETRYDAMYKSVSEYLNKTKNVENIEEHPYARLQQYFEHISAMLIIDIVVLPVFDNNGVKS
jgi:hypothetical protein